MRLGLIGLALVAWGCCPRSALAQESPSPFEIAESYLGALYALDFGTLRTLLASDATFNDEFMRQVGEFELNSLRISHESRD